MGFRFWRRVKIAPGVTLNLSKSSPSLSIGPRGAKLTVSSRGTRATVGVPGTGIFYTTKMPSKSGAGSGVSRSSSKRPVVRPEEKLNIGFFKRLVTPDDEVAFVDGCREFVLGNEDAAFDHLRKAVQYADGAFLAGVLALKKASLDEAERYLCAAVRREQELGALFSKYGMSVIINLAITEEVSAQIEPNIHGVLLALVEVYQRLERRWEAVQTLYRLSAMSPEDVVVKLSLAEIIIEDNPTDKNTFQEILRLAEGVTNESAMHGALLLYKAKALRGMGLNDAAREVIRTTLRIKKSRPPELLCALRYELALVYEAAGQDKYARTELEKIYAEAPGYEDVGKKLGL